MSYIIISIIIIIIIIIIYFGYQYFFKSSAPMIENNDNTGNTNNIINDKNIDTSDTNNEQYENLLEEDESKKNKNSLEEGNPYFIISIGNNVLGKIKFELFDNEAPKTCKNFRHLCTKSLLNNKYPDYQGTIFHRVIKNFMLQGGDITNFDGTGGLSMYGVKFDDENLDLEHNQPGLLCMANSGKDTNNSQFYITLKETPWLDKKHVVFGIILEGFDIIKKIELLEVNGEDKPLEEIRIVKCGLE